MRNQKGNFSTLRDPISVQSVEASAPTQTQVLESTLPSGFRLVTVDRAFPVSSLSLFVKASTRYETRTTSGATHFLKFFAGQSNSQKSGLRLVRDLEHYGATVNVSFDREYINYNISFSRFESQEIQIAAETLRFLLSPLLQEHEVDRIRELVAVESQGQDELQQLLDLAHQVAYRDQGLGQPLYAKPYAIERIDPRHLHRHLVANFKSGNMTLVGTGMEHGKVRDIVNSLFSTGPLIDAEYPELSALPSLEPESPTAQSAKWFGGEARLPSPGDLSRVLLAYQGAERGTKGEAALTIAKAHLSNIKIDDVCSTSVSYLPYTDSGVFAFHGSSVGNAGRSITNLSTAVKKLADVSATDFDLAKTRALTQHLHGMTNVFALANQLSLYGRKNSVKELTAVSLSDFKDAVVRLSQPVVVSSGDVRGSNRV